MMGTAINTIDHRVGGAVKLIVEAPRDEAADDRPVAFAPSTTKSLTLGSHVSLARFCTPLYPIARRSDFPGCSATESAFCNRPIDPIDCRRRFRRLSKRTEACVVKCRSTSRSTLGPR